MEGGKKGPIFYRNALPLFSEDKARIRGLQQKMLILVAHEDRTGTAQASTELSHRGTRSDAPGCYVLYELKSTLSANEPEGTQSGAFSVHAAVILECLKNSTVKSASNI